MVIKTQLLSKLNLQGEEFRCRILEEHCEPVKWGLSDFVHISVLVSTKVRTLVVAGLRTKGEESIDVSVIIF